MTGTSFEERKKAFNDAAETALQNMEYRIYRDPLITMGVMAFAKKALDLTDHGARVRAAQLLAPYVMQGGTMGYAVFQTWEPLVRKIGEADPIRAEKLSGAYFNMMEDSADPRFAKAYKLYSDMSNLVQQNRAMAHRPFQD